MPIHYAPDEQREWFLTRTLRNLNVLKQKKPYTEQKRYEAAEEAILEAIEGSRDAEGNLTVNITKSDFAGKALSAVIQDLSQELDHADGTYNKKAKILNNDDLFEKILSLSLGDRNTDSQGLVTADGEKSQTFKAGEIEAIEAAKALVQKSLAAYRDSHGITFTEIPLITEKRAQVHELLDPIIYSKTTGDKIKAIHKLVQFADERKTILWFGNKPFDQKLEDIYNVMRSTYGNLGSSVVDAINDEISGLLTNPTGTKFLGREYDNKQDYDEIVELQNTLANIYENEQAKKLWGKKTKSLITDKLDKVDKNKDYVKAFEHLFNYSTEISDKEYIQSFSDLIRYHDTEKEEAILTKIHKYNNSQNAKYQALKKVKSKLELDKASIDKSYSNGKNPTLTEIPLYIASHEQKTTFLLKLEAINSKSAIDNSKFAAYSLKEHSELDSLIKKAVFVQKTGLSPKSDSSFSNEEMTTFISSVFGADYAKQLNLEALAPQEINNIIEKVFNDTLNNTKIYDRATLENKKKISKMKQDIDKDFDQHIKKMHFYIHEVLQPANNAFPGLKEMVLGKIYGNTATLDNSNFLDAAVYDHVLPSISRDEIEAQVESEMRDYVAEPSQNILQKEIVIDVVKLEQKENLEKLGQVDINEIYKFLNDLQKISKDKDNPEKPDDIFNRKNPYLSKLTALVKKDKAELDKLDANQIKCDVLSFLKNEVDLSQDELTKHYRADDCMTFQIVPLLSALGFDIRNVSEIDELVKPYYKFEVQLISHNTSIKNQKEIKKTRTDSTHIEEKFDEKLQHVVSKNIETWLDTIESFSAGGLNPNDQNDYVSQGFNSFIEQILDTILDLLNGVTMNSDQFAGNVLQSVYNAHRNKQSARINLLTKGAA